MVVGHFVTGCVLIVNLRWRSVILCPPVFVTRRRYATPDGKQPNIIMSHAAQNPGSCQSLSTITLQRMRISSSKVLGKNNAAKPVYRYILNIPVLFRRSSLAVKTTFIKSSTLAKL